MFADDLLVVMTEEDAIKCIKFSNKKHWYLPIKVKLPESLPNKLNNLLRDNFDG